MKQLTSTSFVGEKFGLSGHFLHRFHTNFTFVNVWTDSNFKALEDRKWRNFLRLTALKFWVRVMLPCPQSLAITHLGHILVNYWGKWTPRSCSALVPDPRSGEIHARLALARVHSGQTQKGTSLLVFQSLEVWISSNSYERKVLMKTMHNMSRQNKFHAGRTCARQLLHFQHILNVKSLSFQKQL